MTPKTNNDWEKEFDKKFVIPLDKKLRAMTLNNEPVVMGTAEEVKSFISSLLSAERQRLRGEIEKMKVNEDMRIDYIQQPNFSILKGRKSYNEALSDILKLFNRD